MRLLSRYLTQYLLILVPTIILGISTMFWVQNTYFTIIMILCMMLVAVATLPILIIMDIKEKHKVYMQYKAFKQGKISKQDLMQELITQLSPVNIPVADTVAIAKKVANSDTAKKHLPKQSALLNTMLKKLD